MSTGKQVKVIKRAAAQRGASDSLGEAGNKRSSPGQRAKQDAVKVVTGWVRELRRKKVEEAVHGFERLFGEAA